MRRKPFTCPSLAGFASVFEGTLRKDGVGSRPVAIKVLNSQSADLTAILNEVRLAMIASQACNFICPVLGAAVHNGAMALVFPRYAVSAADLVEEEHPGGVPLLLALRILEPVARALLSMHTRGVAASLLQLLAAS